MRGGEASGVVATTAKEFGCGAVTRGGKLGGVGMAEGGGAPMSHAMERRASRAASRSAAAASGSLALY